MRDPASTGGMAVAEGLNYEERVAAWAYSQLLAGGSVRRLGALQDWRFTAVWMQAPVPVGDVLVEHSGKGAIFIQAKFRKTPFRFDVRDDGDFYKVFLSFARQYFSANKSTDNPDNPWARQFDPTIDLLALIFPSSAGESSVRLMATVLQRAVDSKVWIAPEQFLNNAEVEKFKIIREVARKAVTQSSVTQPNDEVLRQFLSAIRILILDINDIDPGAGEAQSLLRDSVLSPDSVSLTHEVWNKLVALAREANRAGLRFDISSLSKRLLHEGVMLKVPPAFREDIQRLQDLSKRNLKRMKQLAELRVNADPVEIPRECVNALYASIDAHRVLIGDPGSGKSGVMYQLCNKLLSQHKDVVLLLADDLETESVRPLNEALGIKNSLVDVLGAWNGPEYGYLVIDALDAARDPKLARRLRNAMADVQAGENRWKIVASVRRFDLKHSPETQVLFSGEPVAGFTDSEFNGTSHFNVPPLTESELKVAEGKHPSIAALMLAARRDKTTRDLMSQPFNLSLACELIRAGVGIEKIVPLPTKVALLDRFWSYRVEMGGQLGANKEAVLTTLATNLVKHLSMGLPKDPANYDPAILYDLAEQHILEPGAYGNGVLRFSHHLLHDYAVARLLFRPLSAVDLVQRILNSPELSIYARQSLILHFDHLWDTDTTRKRFWDSAYELVRSSLPLIARILTTECAVSRIQAWSDFAPLLEMRRRKETEGPSATLILYIVSEYLDIVENDRVLKSSQAWAMLALELIKSFPEHYIQVHLLLYKLSEVQALSTECRRLINETGRLLAQNRMNQVREEDRYGREFITAIKTICRTADICPMESDGALRPLLTTQFAALYGDRVYWQFAQEIDHLLKVSPDLVAALYVAVFSNETSADGWENIGGKILSLQVLRKDNYRMAEYHLKDKFPAFFKAFPIAATRAVVKFFPGFRNMHHAPASGKPDVKESFMFLDRNCRIIADYSCIWAADASHHDDNALIILRHVRDGWVSLANSPVQIDAILAEIAENNELAVIWWFLIEAGVEAKDTLGLKLASLLSQPAILVGLDTHHSAAKLLGTIFSRLEPEQRAIIERVIVALPKLKRENQDDSESELDTWRGLYLGRIKPEDLVTNEAKELHETLAQTKGLRPNPPPYSSGGSFSSTSDWADYVPGVCKEELQTPTHREANEWQTKLQRHTTGDRSKPPLAPPDEIWSDITGAYEFVVTKRPSDINPAIAALIWGHLVSVCERIVQAASMPKHPDRLLFLKSLLLKAATDPNPVISEETERHFAESPSWGSPSPRIDAAESLIAWGREFKSLDDEIRSILRILVKDPHPAVRFQILRSCNALYDIDQSLMWELIETGVRNETNLSVWGGLLMALDRISPSHPDKVAALIFDFLKKFPYPLKTNRDPADSAIGILGSLYIRFGHKPSSEFVFRLINEPVKNAHYLAILSRNYRQALAICLDKDSSDYHKQVHDRAIDFILRTVQAAKTALDGLMQKLQSTPDSRRHPILENAKAVLQLLDAVNMQIHFASGAHDVTLNRSKNVVGPPPDNFWKETAPIIRLLVSVENAHIAYNLAETLEYLIPTKPEEIFNQLVILVRNANKDGFAHESLAVGVITRIVERYLAEYSDLFTKHEHCRKGLIEVLDAFASVGWPEARRLIRNLSRIYR